jgi:hypothetical protein
MAFPSALFDILSSSISAFVTLSCCSSPLGAPRSSSSASESSDNSPSWFPVVAPAGVLGNACCFAGALPEAVILAGFLHSSSFGLPSNKFLFTGHLVILNSQILRRRPYGRSNAFPLFSNGAIPLSFWSFGSVMFAPRLLPNTNGTAFAILRR